MSRSLEAIVQQGACCNAKPGACCNAKPGACCNAKQGAELPDVPMLICSVPCQGTSDIAHTARQLSTASHAPEAVVH